MSKDTDLEYDLDKAFVITKSELRDYVGVRISAYSTDYRSLVTQKLIIRTLIYLEGYSQRLKETCTPPVFISDVKRFVLSEGFKYIIKQIEQKQ